MKKNFVKYFILAVFAAVLSGICPYVKSQNSAGPMKLVYNYPADKAVSYLVKTTMAQIMDIQGQTMQTDVVSAFGVHDQSNRESGRQS